MVRGERTFTMNHSHLAHTLRLSRHSDDESTGFFGLLLLLRREHEERFAVTELTFFRRHRRSRLSDADEVFLGKFEGGGFIRRHHIEVNATALTVDPRIVDMNRIRSHEQLLSADDQYDQQSKDNTIVGKDAQGVPLDIGQEGGDDDPGHQE